MGQQENEAVPNTAYIDVAIADWIAEKEGISGSAKTRKGYIQTLTNFRARLRAQGRDLDLDLWADRTDRVAWRQAATSLASEIRDFAMFSYGARVRVADNTIKSRLIAISSFYTFAIGAHFDEYMNPVNRVKRPRGRAYEKSRILPAPRVAAAIRAIDRTTKIGARDYALFAVYFETSRRAEEVLALRWGDVELVGGLQDLTDPSQIQILLNFPHCKGDRAFRHMLSPVASRAILECVALAYALNPLYLDPARPLWRNFSPAAGGAVLALTYNGVRKMCKERLGTSRVHEIRHTVADACEKAGMSLREIQELLGHSNVSTTTLYLSALGKSGENRVVATLDKIFGFSMDERSVTMVEWLPFALAKDAEEGKDDETRLPDHTS